MSLTRHAVPLAGVTASGSGGGETWEAAASPAVTHGSGTTQVPDKPQRVVSVSVTLTGHLLALDAPVIAGQATPPSPYGFFSQQANVAVKRKGQVAYPGKAFGDASLFFISLPEKDIDAKPLWRDLPAVEDKRLYGLGLDYFSATNVVNPVAEFFEAQG